MPLGLVRLNERRQRPNQNISFIKVQDGPEKAIAEDILERVAAIVWPIMRDNHLGVTTLEDFPPNREFWGRNFNAGECIQLVLKSPMTGLWLPFSFVCKVMLHELAHIKQMNHSRAFHAVRIGYHQEFGALVARGYTGEGFWSGGHSLSEGYTAPRHLSEAEMPDNLCGGTYRSAKKPEKRKLTYAERQQKRKERLFGQGEGEKMGSNEKLRASLEKGKSKKAVAVKPRVAQSQRGRDLRLEAALRRQKALEAEASTSAGKKEESASDDSEYETEEEEETVDVGGGNRMVRVGSEGQDEDEWAEFREAMSSMCSATSLSGNKASTSSAGPSGTGRAKNGGGSNSHRAQGKKRKASTDNSATEESDDEVEVISSAAAKSVKPPVKKLMIDSDKEEDDETPPPPSYMIKKRGPEKFKPAAKPDEREEKPDEREESDDDDLPPPLTSEPAAASTTAATTSKLNAAVSCSICTMENDPDLALCTVCGNVLDTARTPNWKCTSSACAGTSYSNPKDAGICGCCGTRRPD